MYIERGIFHLVLEGDQGIQPSLYGLANSRKSK